MDQQYTDCLSELETVKAERDALAAKLEKAERISDREATGFRAMCEAFENLEAIVGLDTGGGMGPGPALNAVESIMREREALAAHVERLTSDICALIDNSEGVVGLHLNGDVAPWADLTQGGHFESWLLSLADAPETSLARLKAKWQAETLEGVLTCCEKCPPGKSHKDVLRVVDQMARAQRDLIRRQAGGDA